MEFGYFSEAFDEGTSVDFNWTNRIDSKNLAKRKL
jgi:hypothetical protein